MSSNRPASGADLRKFMEKRLDLQLNGNRHVVGILRGYDTFMNLVLDNAIEITKVGSGASTFSEKKELGQVVIRGSSVGMWECIDKVK